MVTSTSSARVKALLRLRSRRERDRSGTFVVEGGREVARALSVGASLREVCSCPSFHTEAAAAAVEAAAASGVPVVRFGEEAFRRASYRERPDGVLAVAATHPTDPEAVTLPGNALALVVEAVEKPGNLGAMLRTADATGAAVLVCDPATDPFNPNVVRASLGTLFTVPLGIGSSERTLAHLRNRGVRLVATSPAAELAYWDADLSGAVAVIVGAEHEGLSPTWLNAADVCVRIPMEGAADSLNAGIAAAVVLFEACRQRARSEG